MSTRPSFAPKPALDIRHIRQNPGLYEQNCIDRNYPSLARHSWRILELHDKWKSLQESSRQLRERNNVVVRELGAARRGSSGHEGGKEKTRDDAATRSEPDQRSHAELIAEARYLKTQLDGFEKDEKTLQAEIDTLALALPNLSSTFTPNGDKPKVLGYINDHLLSPSPRDDNNDGLRSEEQRQEQQQKGKSHTEIGAELDLLDFQGAASTSGWGWYFLRNEAAMLEQALIQHALDVARNFHRRKDNVHEDGRSEPDAGNNGVKSKSTRKSRGWMVVSPPSMVYSHIASACGFQPRDQHNEQQIYTVASSPPSPSPTPADSSPSSSPSGSHTPVAPSDQPTHCLAGTAEIPLAGMLSSRLLDATDLPIKTIGASRCFRAEAGARGVGTKGLYRVHEFTKVEMFAWTMPSSADSGMSDAKGRGGGGDRFGVESDSDPESDPEAEADADASTAQDKVFEEMLAIQKAILKSLDLPCRVLEMPAVDLGASASRKIDIEAWFPSRRRAGTLPPSDPSSTKSTTSTTGDGGPSHDDSGWGEVTSVSTCDMYQSRRLATKVKFADGTRSFPCTVNGTALAVPRVLAAILENGWDEESQSVIIPEVLRRWMGGQERITKR